MNRSLQIEVPGYRIERILGKGGMATVYLATQMSLGRPVALKVLHDPDTPQFFERFFNEGRCIARLNHSNLIAIFDIGQGDGFYYIAMEYLPGGDLKSRIVQGIKPAQALKILGRLAGCLAYVHGEGVIHRDIKPSNILFRNDGSPVLTDFGIAKLIQTDNDLTVTGTVMGSPHYLSPELAQGIRRVDGRSDLYSLGIILYEMLTGRKPYTADSFAATLMAHIQKPLPQLPEQFASLQPVLDKLLAKKPEDRFQSGAELAMTLQSLRGKIRSDKRPLFDTPTEQEPPPETLALETTNGTSKKRFRWPLLVGLGLIVLLGALGLRQLTSDDEAEQAAAALPDKTTNVEPIAVVAPAAPQIEEPAEPVVTEAVAADNPDTEPKPEAEPETEVATAPVSTAPAHEDKRISKIDDLLAKAQSQLASDHLSYPANSSARFYYNAVLKQDPDNRAALRGLDKIADRYADLAQTKLEKGHQLRARRYITQGLDIRPQHERLIRLMNQLNRPTPPASSNDIFDQLNPDSDR
ncbi:serine/threonine protein kinase [Sedimenticola sp.]|uniref:serine/threonine protein kinase n=1 Tax=Sedimenticola sp. TaxID=1940285 RepID=UPI003D0F1CA5